MSERLFLAELEAFDPHAPAAPSERRFCCPLCGQGKPKDSAHRSMNVNIKNGAFICQRCDARGKLADFWENRPKMNPREFARQRLQQLTALPTPTEEVPLDAEAQQKADDLRAQLDQLQPIGNTRAASYLIGRGISLDVARPSIAGFSPNWYGRAAVVFPIQNRAGEVVAAQGRYVDGREHVKTRTFGPKSQGIFMASGALDIPALIITEAPIDALSLAVAGYPAIALCGKSGPDWLPQFCFCKRVFLAFDADDAGDDAADKLIPSLQSFGATCHRLRPEDAKDWNEFLTLYGRDELSDFLAVQFLGNC